ncbi:AraC family transcriptional regulator [Nocardia niigatensis]|uniref:AraC family transcriptional regulator n=1 Tax=Nocardia niigatensis TaxID=209249 RepID=UPI0003094D0C|nr:AraC family transcriptional regulator [Nocardia niigatensis]
MAVVFDTRPLPRHERAAAMAATIEEGVAAADVRFADPRAVHGRIEMWSFGAVQVFRSESAGVEVLRTARHVRAGPAGIVGVARQLDGTRVHEHHGVQEVLTPGTFGVVDVDAPFSLRVPSPSISVSLRVSLDDLDLPGDTLRAAALGVRASPLYPMVSGFIADLACRAEDLESDPGAVELGRSSVDLIRALVVSAAGGRAADGSGAALPSALLMQQIETYLRAHLRRHDVTAAEVAAAHNISVRQLYRLWADAGRSMRQWMIEERLALARRMLIDPRHADRTIGWIARATGFRDASHFTRRFRAAYDVGPRDWRATGEASADGQAMAPAYRQSRGVMP